VKSSKIRSRGGFQIEGKGNAVIDVPFDAKRSLRRGCRYQQGVEEERKKPKKE